MEIAYHYDFADGSEGKESAHTEGDLSLIPGSERFPGEGNGDPLMYTPNNWKNQPLTRQTFVGKVMSLLLACQVSY